MQTKTQNSSRRQRGSVLVVWLVITLIISFSLAALGVYVAQTSNLTQRRSYMVAATQYAEGGAVMAVSDMNTAITTNISSSLITKLTSIPYAPYTLSSNLGGGTNLVYTRTISAGAPFAGQPVHVQIWLPNVSPTNAQIISSATVGPVTQTATVNVKIGFGLGAAVLSVNDGTSDTSASKSAALAGNVAINGGGSPLVIYGGPNALAVRANGEVNVSSTNTSVVDIPASGISKNNYTAGTSIPDYTSQGTSNTLFDINRFIAVANNTPNGYSPATNNHFTNLTTFVAAVNAHASNNPLQGMIVVDVLKSDPGLTTQNVPNGINVEGSLIFNFVGPGWSPTSKIVVDTPVTVNPANLSGLVATNPATYTTGYPPTYTDPTKNPVNINITNAVDPATGLKDFQNFASSDDLPALVYTIGVVDLHNALNISGVMYTPSYMEIENKNNGAIQYMSGEVIMGNGIYYENTSQQTTSIITYDAGAVNNLATAHNVGKMVSVMYWQ